MAIALTEARAARSLTTSSAERAAGNVPPLPATPTYLTPDLRLIRPVIVYVPAAKLSVPPGDMAAIAWLIGPVSSPPLGVTVPARTGPPGVCGIVTVCGLRIGDRHIAV